MLDKLIQLDRALFLWLNGFHSPFWDKVMWFISGKLEWLPLYILIIAFLIYRYRGKSILIILSIILAVALADQIAVIAFKQVFERLRPTHDSELSELVHIVRNYRGGMYGFVSNHAANSFALATILSLIIRDKFFVIGILFWASVVSYSRIYLGVHYPADIVGGAMLGALLGGICYWLYLKTQAFIEARQKN